MNKTAETLGAGYMNTTSYSDLLSDFDKHWNTTMRNYKLTLPVNCWVIEALEITKRVNSLLLNQTELDKMLQEGSEAFRTAFSIIQLAEFLFTIKGLGLLGQESIAISTRKLKDILQMPLLVQDEDMNTNQGRNSLFELRLAVIFANAGYTTVLAEQNPDFIVTSDEGYKYAVECKRIFKIESLVRNVKDARDQLVKHSLGTVARRGIVALGVTRAINSGGHLKLAVKTTQEASDGVYKQLGALYSNNQANINAELPYQIPALILDYSDIAEIDKLYWIQRQLLVKLDKAGSNKVVKDFERLLQ